MAKLLTQDVIDSDPTIQAIARSQGGTGRADTSKHIQANQRILAYLQSQGYELPQGQWVDQSGKLAEMPKGMNWWALLAPAAVAGGAGLAAALGGGGAAAGALPATQIGTGAATLPAVSASGAVPAALAGGALPAATGGTLASTALGTGAATLPAGATSGAVPAALGGAAATAGKSLWSKIAAPLLSAGLNVAQGAISAHAANKAAEQQQAATMAALGLQKEIWEKQQANLAPYMQTGTGALGRLNGLTALRPAGQVFGGQ